jgi:hypothetical protein
MATLLRRKLLREEESKFGKVYREVGRKEWGRHSCQMNVGNLKHAPQFELSGNDATCKSGIQLSTAKLMLWNAEDVYSVSPSLLVPNEEM